MGKSILLVLGMALFFWAVPAHAQKSFVTDELTSDATRLEQNVGKDLGLATQPLAKLRKDADQVLARKDFKTAALAGFAAGLQDEPFETISIFVALTIRTPISGDGQQ